MKRFLGYLVAAASLVLLSVSCHKAVRADATGQVDEITDSVMIVRIDGSKVKFDITDCNFTNGAVMYGDSVIIGYVGDLSASYCVAETCYLIVKKSDVVVADTVRDTSKELKTRPVDKKKAEEIDNLVRIATKRNAK